MGLWEGMGGGSKGLSLAWEAPASLCVRVSRLCPVTPSPREIIVAS